MAASIPSVISDFEDFLSRVSSKTVQNPAYPAAKTSWSDLLAFLAPVVTNRYFPDRETRVAAELHQIQEASVQKEGIVERTLYFGVLSFYVLCSNKMRDLYRHVNREELTEKWFSAALYPVEALEEYGFFEIANRRTIETLASRFFLSEIEPFVEDPRRHDTAFQFFVTQYYSGLLLGQLTDALTLREYCRIQDAR